jgi:carboxyl-terminal processing protease
MNRCRFLFLLLTLTIGCTCLHAQNAKQVLHSNSKSIKYFVNGVKDDWRVEPSVKIDYLKLYSATEKTKKVKFVSDIDSIEFTVKANKPVNFAIVVKNNDTAFTAINFTNAFENTLNTADKVYALSLFWSEVKYNFAFIDEIKFNIDSLYKAYIPKVAATKNDYEFYDLMKLFVGSFKDRHTNISYNNAFPYIDYISMTAGYFGNDLYLINVRSDLAKTYPVGSKIVKINGLPAKEYMAKYVEPYILSDFPSTLKYLSASQLFAAKPYKDSMAITYQTPSGKILTNTPPRDGKTKSNIEVLGHPYPRLSKPFEISWKEDSIAVLGLNTFNDTRDELIPYFDKIKDTLYSAKGIVIDLRQNRGGSTEVAWHIIKHMIKDTYFLNYAWQTRINSGVKRANGDYIKANRDFLNYSAYQTFRADTVFIPDSIKRFNVPMVVIFSEMTVSAAEDFLIILKERKDRPMFIGRPSFGSTGSPLVLRNLSSNGSARICTRRVLFPYSLKPFNEGIVPDIIVDYSFNEFMTPDLDKEINTAIEELKKQMK